MEVAVGQKHKQLEFAVASVSELASPSSKISTSSTVVACFGFDSGVAEVRFYRESYPDEALHVALPTSQVRFYPLMTFFGLLLRLVWLQLIIRLCV